MPQGYVLQLVSSKHGLSVSLALKIKMVQFVLVGGFLTGTFFCHLEAVPCWTISNKHDFVFIHHGDLFISKINSDVSDVSQ